MEGEHILKDRIENDLKVDFKMTKGCGNNVRRHYPGYTNETA